VLNGTPAAVGYGLDSLTWAERVICGPLIRRQFGDGLRIQRILSKYGLRGTARLCSARAFLAFCWIFAVLAIPLALVGEGIGEAILFCLAVLNGVLAELRVISAVRAGKKWRSAK
jgi:hypothetical protein